MSDISVLSNQYDKLVSTSDKVNNSVIALKKKNILSNSAGRERYPKLSVSSEELSNAKVILLSFLGNVEKLLEKDFTESDYIPMIILEDYKKRLSINPYIKDELKKLLDLLKDNQPIAEENLTVLDGILSILDNERSTLFRKLRNARG